MFKGGAFESMFSPANSARSKEMRSILPLRAAYLTDDSVDAGRSRHVEKSFVLSLPTAKKNRLGHVYEAAEVDFYSAVRQPESLLAVRVDERREVCEEGVPFRVCRLVLVQGVPGLLRHPK